ncbi:TPA: hypothetical protein PXP39_000779 [Yersinia enterocolitica]|nr:hypothetical protein [Yersinia enterocolitica]HDL7830944.1 hypothetical protein [Yersinia enterocolitica]HDL7871800.1 hypothetical protein [Yersinia enterocolitica]HDL7883650.1 hypothetical protein [Yersinia enterocolitica]HDL7895603.1 hypothetical protein [Yersinia enterocolitica]
MLPDINRLDSTLTEVIGKLDLSYLSADDTLELANSSEECYAGLLHGLNFIGDTFVTFADNEVLDFSAESLCQLGHCLASISILLPALTQLQTSASGRLTNNALNEQ